MLRITLSANGSLYCCSDGVRGRGAAVKYLSHNASFHSKEKIAPSNRGIKQFYSGVFPLVGLLSLNYTPGSARTVTSTKYYKIIHSALPLAVSLKLLYYNTI